MTFEWGPFPEDYSLANPEHCAWLAQNLLRKLAEGTPGSPDKKLVLGIPDKKLVRAALDACTYHGYAPPRELTDLVARLLRVPFDENGRSGIKDRELFEIAARTKAETGLSGRPLARRLREMGHDAKDRTIASWEKVGDWHAKGAHLRMQTVAHFEYLVRRYRGDDE